MEFRTKFDDDDDDDHNVGFGCKKLTICFPNTAVTMLSTQNDNGVNS